MGHPCLQCPHEPLERRSTSPSCGSMSHNSSRFDRHARPPWRRTRDYGVDPTTSVPPARYHTQPVNTRPERKEDDHTHVHAETTLGAHRVDGGSGGRFVLAIDRAGLFVRLFYDAPQFLFVKGRASRADVVDGRFTFVDGRQSDWQWVA